jgi:hypothetical protein
MSLRVVVGQRLNGESGRQFKGDENVFGLIYLDLA